MSDDKKQKGNWRLLLVGVVLGSVITVGASWIFPSDFNRAKNTVINTVKNFNWGFGKSKTIEESIERKTKTSPIEKYTETTKYLSGKSFWNWLELAGTLAVPILIFIFGLWFQQRENKRAEEQDIREREIAQDNLAEEAIQNYLDDIAKLLLNKELRKELYPDNELKLLDKDNPIRDVARIQTITILRRLEDDIDRQARILHFLRDTKLYEFILKNINLSVASLKGANLEGANLKEANLWGADLKGAYLVGADLKRAYLVEAYLAGADLKEANLRGADLEGANLFIADLWQADLEGANLFMADLWQADLRGAYLKEANLRSAYLKEANLWGADLRRADLEGADLEGANLWQANLREADLRRANLRGAHLREADLRRANLRGTHLEEAVDITREQIKLACFWEEAFYKKGRQKENQKFIEDLKKDKSSDPKERPVCSIWEKQKDRISLMAISRRLKFLQEDIGTLTKN